MDRQIFGLEGGWEEGGGRSLAYQPDRSTSLGAVRAAMSSWSSWWASGASGAPAPTAPASGSAAVRWHWSPARWLATAAGGRGAWTSGAWHALSVTTDPWGRVEAPPLPPAGSGPWSSPPPPPPLPAGGIPPAAACAWGTAPAAASSPAASAPSVGAGAAGGYGDWAPHGWWTRAAYDEWRDHRETLPAERPDVNEAVRTSVAGSAGGVPPVAVTATWLNERPARALALGSRRPPSTGPRRRASPGARGRSPRPPRSRPAPSGPAGGEPAPEPSAVPLGPSAAQAVPPPGDRVHTNACVSCDQLIGNAFAWTGLYNGDPLCEVCSDVEYLRVCIERYQPSQTERRILRLGIRVLVAQALGSHGARIADVVAAAEADAAAAEAAARPSPAAAAPETETGGASSSAAGGPTAGEQPSWLAPEEEAQPAAEPSTTAQP